MMLNRPASETQITHLQRLWLYVVCAVICFLLVAPSFVVIPMSFSASEFLEFPPEDYSLRWFRSYLDSIEWREATTISFTAAILTVLLATPIGTMAAYGLHVSKTRWSALVQLALTMPLMVPLILTGIAVFFMYARLELNNTLLGIVVAHSMLALPFVLVTVTAGLKSYDMNQEMVARSLGAGRLKAFVTVTLPQIKTSIISGALFAFITSLDEVVVALFIARGDSSTLTRRMFASLRDQIDPTIAAISTLLIAVSIAALVIGHFFGAQKQPQS